MELKEVRDNKYIPPLSLQMLLENALKHNKFSMKKPLRIQVYADGDYLVVRNDFRPLSDNGDANTGSGLENIFKRYALISNTEPVIEKTEEFFVAKLPLLTVENR